MSGWKNPYRQAGKVLNADKFDQINNNTYHI